MASTKEIDLSKSRGFTDWVLTIFDKNYIEFVDFVHTIRNEFVYIIFQLEKGASHGTPHLQGFIQFYTRKRLTTVSNLLGSKNHYEPRRGTVKECIVYCSKDETLVSADLRHTQGEPIYRTGQGAGADLEEIISALRGGSALASIVHDYPLAFVRHHRGIERWLQLYSRNTILPGTRKTYYFWGPSGAGKTFNARLLAKTYCDEHSLSEEDEVYWLTKPQFGQPLWWTGYRGQAVIIIDEYGEGWIDFDRLMRITDPHPTPVYLRVHGDYVPLTSSIIIFTGNIHPHNIHNSIHDREVRFPGWKRRLDTIFHVQSLNSLVPSRNI